MQARFWKITIFCILTCTAVSKRLQNEWKTEQHSSNLKVAGSSQKNSATVLLKALSSWKAASKLASLASALWITEKGSQLKCPQLTRVVLHLYDETPGEDFTRRNVSTCWMRPECLLLLSFASLIFLTSFSYSATTSSLQILWHDSFQTKRNSTSYKPDSILEWTDKSNHKIT